MTNKSSKGFAHLFLVIVVVIVAIGWVVYYANTSGLIKSGFQKVKHVGLGESCEGYITDIRMCRRGLVCIHESAGKLIAADTPGTCQYPTLTGSLADTSDFTNWKTYSQQGFSFKYPPVWKEKPIQLTGSGSYLEIEDEKGVFTLTFTYRGNYNNSTGKPYSTLQEFANMPYPGKKRVIDEEEGMQYVPRAGSEHSNSVFFFSKDRKIVYTLELTTNTKSDEQIQQGQQLFDQILSTFKFIE